MRRHYLELWLLLATAFIIFAVASAMDSPTIAGHALHNAGIHQAVFGQREDKIADSELIVDEIDSLAIAIATPQFPVPVDTASQIILFIGDSMLDGLGPRLAAYAEHNGHKLYNVIWYSSTTETWGKSDKLKSYIERLRPTYIMISLGANELFVKDIASKRQQFVRNILSDIDTIPYLWIGPPNWKEDTGINDLIAANTPRGTFFLSNGMEFRRGKDGAHPTRESAAQWLDSIARWMPDSSLYPIRMTLPEKASGRATRVFVHQPSEK